MATKKTATKQAGRTTASKRTATKTEPKPASANKAMPKSGKDPKGGLTAKGREFFAATEGSHLRPGVQGPADTPEKMVRKGSFLRRHFANPRGPMKDAKGAPTRLALSAHAWGEPVPQTMADAEKLAEEGHELLEQYHEAKDAVPATSAKSKTASKKSAGGSPKTRSGSAKAPAKTATKRAGSKAPAKKARGQS